MDNQERRRYFRVDSEMIFTYKLISHEEKAQKARKLNLGDVNHPDSHRLFITLESDIQEALLKFSKAEPQMAHLINLLNRKINLLSQGGPLGKTQDSIMDLVPEMINISACGIAFKSTEPLKLGDAAQIELVLLPEQAYILAYGEVISCEKKPLSPTCEGPASHPYRISLDFQAIRDDDVERIIQHIMRKEAEILKSRRHLQ